MLIFSSTPGVVAAEVVGQALPFSIAVGGTNNVPSFPAYLQAKAILTGFALENETGLGVAHTLRDRIYVYVHGERAGTAMVSGIMFGGVCGDEQGPRYTGMDAIYAYYERVRASTQGLPVRLVFGPRTTLVGFMTGLSMGVDDAQTGVGAFRFKFLSLPRYAGRFGFRPPLPWEADPAAIPPADPNAGPAPAPPAIIPPADDDD